MNQNEKQSLLRQLEKQRLDIMPNYEKARRDFHSLDQRLGAITTQILNLQRELKGNIVVVTNEKGFGEVKKTRKIVERKKRNSKLKDKIRNTKLSEEDKKWLEEQLLND